MHAIFFGLKRAFHATLRITRKGLKGFELTAARFDLMWAISQTGGRFMLQSQLRRELGVTAPVVSRMLQSLKALGFVRVERCQHVDRRQCVVRLTKVGLERIRAAAKFFIDGRVARNIIDRVLGTYGIRGEKRAHVIFRRTWQLEDMLRWTRAFCGDTATLHYPWHPDD